MKYISPFLLFTICLVAAADDTDYESKLREDIIAKLPKDVTSRPIHIGTNMTNVNIYVAISHIIGLDAKTETFSINGWIWESWDDQRIKWDRADYGGLDRLRLPENVVWKPKLLPYNSARFSEIGSLYSPADITATYEGWIYWTPAMTSHTICPMDFRWFPYDQHDCFIELGPWSYSGREVNITVSGHLKEQTELVDYGDVNNEWELIKLYRERDAPSDNPYNWHSVKVHFQVRRRAPYYQLLLVLPIVISIILCLVVFWIPASIKPIVISFNLLHLTLFVAHIYWVIPRSGSSAPAILILTSNTLALTGVSLLFSLITIYLSQRNDESFPPFLQNLLAGLLGTILCLKDASPNVGARLSDSDNVQVEVASADQNASKKSLWMLLATAVDRLLFIIYVIAFFIIIIVAFA